jgi:hypothetical protein
MPRVAVIISTWIGNPADYILNLMKSITRYEAGVLFDLYLCANGESYRLPSGLNGKFTDVFIRENTGFNLGAWDYSWRRLSEYDDYLFMQDDCFIRKEFWLRDFLTCFHSKELYGLVGECLHKSWNRPWSELTGPEINTKRRQRVSESKTRLARSCQSDLKRWGIPEGKKADHLTSVVHFTSRAILERVGGYIIADKYQEAIAAEIAFSKKIQNEGYELKQIGRLRHSRIGHRQWHSNGFFAKMERSIKKRQKRFKNLFK